MQKESLVPVPLAVWALVFLPLLMQKLDQGSMLFCEPAILPSGFRMPVITGEGQLDYQTRFGKAPYGVAKATKQSSPQTRVIAIAASLGDRVTELYADQLIDVIFASQTRVKPLGQTMEDATNDLTMTAESIGWLIKIC